MNKTEAKKLKVGNVVVATEAVVADSWRSDRFAVVVVDPTVVPIELNKQSGYGNRKSNAIEVEWVGQRACWPLWGFYSILPPEGEPSAFHHARRVQKQPGAADKTALVELRHLDNSQVFEDLDAWKAHRVEVGEERAEEDRKLKDRERLQTAVWGFLKGRFGVEKAFDHHIATTAAELQDLLSHLEGDRQIVVRLYYSELEPIALKLMEKD